MRQIRYRDNLVRDALIYLCMLMSATLIATVCFASDTHQTGQSHRIVYVVTDSSGNPVTGQTVNVAVQRSSDQSFLDWSDLTFKSSGWTTRVTTLPYDARGEYYTRVLTIDTTTTPLISGDYVIIVSNDSATYGDQQAEVVLFDNLNQLIKIHR